MSYLSDEETLSERIAEQEGTDLLLLQANPMGKSQFPDIGQASMTLQFPGTVTGSGNLHPALMADHLQMLPGTRQSLSRRES